MTRPRPDRQFAPGHRWACGTGKGCFSGAQLLPGGPSALCRAAQTRQGDEGRREMPPGEVQVMSRAVLITGCSTGIGRTVMEGLTAIGHAVVATARRAESSKGCCRFDRAGAGCHRLGRHGSCRRRDPAAARAYRRAAQRCRVRGPRSSRGGPGRCVPAMVDVNVCRRLADGPPGRCCLRRSGGRRCPTRRAITSAGRGGLHGHRSVSRSG